MGITAQILLGTATCAICAVLQLIIVARGLRVIDNAKPAIRLSLTIYAVLLILVAHLVQIAIWTALLAPFGGFETLEAALYFAIASYTTLGYGDVLIAPELRVFGATAAVAGLLSFGISTAFLFGALSELIRNRGS
ncbi:MAG: ion channel [Pseudomonadota bacterium]